MAAHLPDFDSGFVQMRIPGDQRRRLRGWTNPLSKSDRKSTRLNSSHRCISYAVFCLKKKKKKRKIMRKKKHQQEQKKQTTIEKQKNRRQKTSITEQM